MLIGTPCGHTIAVRSSSDNDARGSHGNVPHGAHAMAQNNSEEVEEEERRGWTSSQDDLTNQQLHEQLRSQVPNYDWQHKRRGGGEEENFDFIQILGPTEPIKYVERGTQHMRGRGSVNVSPRHPQYYLEIVRQWFNRLKWHPRRQGPNNPSTTVTFIECVVDFDLTTSHCLGAIKGQPMTWAEKAKRLAYYLKTLARTHQITWNGLKVSYKQALRPTIDAASLTPLGAPILSGFLRKPIWVDKRTPRVVALNAWKARVNHMTAMGTTDLID